MKQIGLSPHVAFAAWLALSAITIRTLYGTLKGVRHGI